MCLSHFHPQVSQWFLSQFDAPTRVQEQAWPAIASGEHTLIAAPTGSGKTLAAFLTAINQLLLLAIDNSLDNHVYILYVSPLKALSNDIQKNLQTPLTGITNLLAEQGEQIDEIRAQLRTGDTPQSARTKMRKTRPHILVTTPESLFLLLTSQSGRDMLADVSTVIVDEIHALAGNKRGAHLTLSLERLQALSTRQISRVGISATQKPIQAMANFLVGDRQQNCHIVDTGYVRERDIALLTPMSPLTAIMSNEVWQEVYGQLEELILTHRTTLIFVNTRRLAERAARFLAERLGEEQVTSHHGSLAKEHRLRAETRLKAGELKALVATASLELGIDIGDIDLVCQLGSPKSIAAFLQRVGRSGHSINKIPKGRLIPLTRDDLIESLALLKAVQEDVLDQIRLCEMALDVLSQHLVAELGNRDWHEDELYSIIIRAYPYRHLSVESYQSVLHMLAHGFSTRRGRRGAYIHWDRVNGKLRGRPNARLTALTNAGAISDQFDYDVVLAPESISIGSLNEDFAFESLPGDIFQLGNRSYRIQKVQSGKVYVDDANGQPPNIPFWVGESPGRTDELSVAVSELRSDIDQQLERQGADHCFNWLVQSFRLDAHVAHQLLAYLEPAKTALSVLPSQSKIVLERFFDEAGDMHLVLHSVYGSRLNRAWGLALRKRFCRKFNFELQAAALEDALVLSLGETHSFKLDEVINYLHPDSVKEVLIQALLDAPMFATHWRWNASIALAIKRNVNGRKQPAQFQRSDAEDLIAVIFPDQLACLENIAGSREIPDHPLVTQTINDCINDLMDINGLRSLLKRIRSGDVEVICRDLTAPSPLAQEIINARPFAFLDPAPAEERRTLAIRAPNDADLMALGDTSILSAEAIARVREEAWPTVRNSDELHDALCLLGCMHQYEVDQIDPQWMKQLMDENRMTRFSIEQWESWVSAERLSELQALHHNSRLKPMIEACSNHFQGELTCESSLIELVRSRLECSGPIRVDQLATLFHCGAASIEQALLHLEHEGFAMRGQYEPGQTQEQWCDRRLLARIHRYSLSRLRREHRPISAADYFKFLLNWHRLTDKPPAESSLIGVIDQLEGFPIAAAQWEQEVLAQRLKFYRLDMLDTATQSGQIMWLRLHSKQSSKDMKRFAAVRSTPMVMMSRKHVKHWQAVLRQANDLPNLSSTAASVHHYLEKNGASFADDIAEELHCPGEQIKLAISELVAQGLIHADGFAGLRGLLNKHKSKSSRLRQRMKRLRIAPIEQTGRWTLIKKRPHDENQSLIVAAFESLEHICWVLLKRYGVMFRALCEREPLLPPWRDLLYVYRRLEARGEIRGGRFVDGFSGEQFAHPEAIAQLKPQSIKSPEHSDVIISACDPLNLIGIIIPGRRVPAQLGNSLYIKGGSIVAVKIAGEMIVLDESMDPFQFNRSAQLVSFSDRDLSKS